ncbi:MAG: type II secretion system major pseudopilin GspG [Planctomycetota bacterium]
MTESRRKGPVARATRRAFTLIEVLIVLGIVLALSAIIGVAVFGASDEADVKLAETDLNNIEKSMQFFRLDFGRYPTEDEGIAVLWNRELLETDDEADEAKWKSYLEDPIPTDRWGNEWGYREGSEYGQDYDLWSNGPDGEEDTEDDITSWAGAAGGEDGEFGDDFLAPPMDAP